MNQEIPDSPESEEDPEEMLKSKVVATKLKVSESTLSRWRDKKVGPYAYAYPGNQYRYKRKEVDAWLRENRF